jgi:hypothetical protein
MLKNAATPTTMAPAHFAGDQVLALALSHLEAWMKKTLTKQDEIVLEMTTNTWQLYDELCEHAGSVTVVHPPHVALITRSLEILDLPSSCDPVRRSRRYMFLTVRSGWIWGTIRLRRSQRRVHEVLAPRLEGDGVEGVGHLHRTAFGAVQV